MNLERILNERLEKKKINILRIINGKKPERNKISAREFRQKFRSAAIKSLRKYAEEEFNRTTYKIKQFIGITKNNLDEEVKKFTKKNLTGFIYLFEGNDRNGKKYSLYIGRTKGKGRRVKAHTNLFKYPSLRLLLFKVKNKRNLAAAECLGWHKYSPIFNRKAPSKKEKRPRCPVCLRVKAAEKYLEKGLIKM